MRSVDRKFEIEREIAAKEALIERSQNLIDEAPTWSNPANRPAGVQLQIADLVKAQRVSDATAALWLGDKLANMAEEQIESLNREIAQLRAELAGL